LFEQVFKNFKKGIRKKLFLFSLFGLTSKKLYAHPLRAVLYLQS